MQDFWTTSGFNTLSKNDHGWLRVTPDYLRLLLQRPELAPVAESGARERALHQALLDDPQRAIGAAELAGIEDGDARQNYNYFLQWRKALLDAVTLERFYLQAFRKGAIDLPPLFLDMAAHAITRGLLDGCEDVYMVRAGEMFFRQQRMSTEGAQVLSADAETIQVFAETGGFGSVGRLFQQQATPMRSVNMDVLNHENGQLYWLSEGRYNHVLDLTSGSNGSEALAGLLARWVKHFFGLEVSVTPLGKIEDEAWRWHIGLDVASTAIMNDLYNGVEVDEARLQQLVALFRLDFARADDMRPDVAGKPVYLGIAMNDDNVLKLKPQNLLLNLPLARTS